MVIAKKKASDFISDLPILFPKLRFSLKKKSSLRFHFGYPYFIPEIKVFSKKKKAFTSIIEPNLEKSGQNKGNTKIDFRFQRCLESKVGNLEMKSLLRDPKFEYPPLLIRPFIPHTLIKLLEGMLLATPLNLILVKKLLQQISTYNFNETYKLACKNLKNNKGKIYHYILLLSKNILLVNSPYNIIC